MAHENDSFIREVNEELRSDQFRSAWSRYGKVVIVAAALIVIGTAGYRGFEYWDTHNSSQSGDKFIAALKLASENKNDEALAALSAIEADGVGAYPVLAKMRAGSVQAAKGDTTAAIATFSEVGNNSAVPQAVRDLAKLRAGWLLIDSGSFEQVSAQVQVLTGSTHPLANSAREALGLAAYRAGNMVEAKQWFQQIAGDAVAPRNIASRAQIMLDNIASSGKAP